MQLIVVGMGMFVGPNSLIMITLPIYLPIIRALGFDLVWFGVIMVVCFTSLFRLNSDIPDDIVNIVIQSALACCFAWGLVDGVFGVYASEELGWVGILLLAGLALGGMALQARDLTPDDAVISPDQFRNPGLGGSGGGPAAA